MPRVVRDVYTGRGMGPVLDRVSTPEEIAAFNEAAERDRLYNESRSAISALSSATAQQYVRPEEWAQLEGKTVGESMDLLKQINARGNAAT